MAIMVAARDHRLGAVAVDSSYTDLEESIGQHLKLLYHLPKIPFLMFVSLTYRIRFGVWPRQMSPITTIAEISPRCVFLIQSEHDPRLPQDEARVLHEAAEEPKALWVVPSGAHLGGFAEAPAEYIDRLVRFYDSCLRR